jgi:hypothetical protein
MDTTDVTAVINLALIILGLVLLARIEGSLRWLVRWQQTRDSETARKESDRAG